MSKILEFAENHGLTELKLNCGSGGERYSGWINIDLVADNVEDSSRGQPQVDIEMDIRHLDCPDGTVDRMLLVHVFEHFVRWEGINLLEHFNRKLKRNGVLFLETPDLDKCIEIYLQNKADAVTKTPLGNLNFGFTQFYGNQWDQLDHETHRYVWTKPELKTVLFQAGFNVLSCDNNAHFHVPGRDIFCIATKR